MRSRDDLRSDLVQVAQRIVARDGAAALTMRALAAEAGCAVGLPYKVFASRDEGESWSSVAAHLPDVLCVRAVTI